MYAHTHTSDSHLNRGIKHIFGKQFGFTLFKFYFMLTLRPPAVIKHSGLWDVCLGWGCTEGRKGHNATSSSIFSELSLGMFITYTLRCIPGLVLFLRECDYIWSNTFLFFSFFWANVLIIKGCTGFARHVLTFTSSTCSAAHRVPCSQSLRDNGYF